MNSDKNSNYPGDDADLYESLAEKSGWHGHEILFGLMYEYLVPGATLLDVGIGTGLSSVLFHKAGLQVSGFDNSPALLEVGRSKGFSGSLIRHDLRKIPFPYRAESFDHIISLGVLNFFADLESVFAEVSRIISPGGIFGFSFEAQKSGQDTCYSLPGNKGSSSGPGKSEYILYRHGEDKVRELLHNNSFFLLKELEFAADQTPGQGKKIYFKLYAVQKGAL